MCDYQIHKDRKGWCSRKVRLNHAKFGRTYFLSNMVLTNLRLQFTKDLWNAFVASVQCLMDMCGIHHSPFPADIIENFWPSIIQNFENQMTSVEFWLHFWTQTMSKTLSYFCSFNPWTGHLGTNQLGWWVAKQSQKIRAGLGTRAKRALNPMTLADGWTNLVALNTLTMYLSNCSSYEYPGERSKNMGSHLWIYCSMMLSQNSWLLTNRKSF